MVCPQCGKRYPADTEVCETDGSRLSSLTEDSYIGYPIANFRLKERIGRGGFGLVYLAEHVELGNEVAIKILRKQYTTDDQLVERFKREARVSSQIRHPNVVQISDFGFDPTIGFYYIMEYLDGVSLADVMKEYTRGMPVERMLPILRQICAALDVAHSHNVVHRDLKPSNIFLLTMYGQSDFVKILDFGIAKVLQGEEGQGVTATGQIVGSPRFMSPEQARGRHNEVDQRSDIYAMGVMIFWMLTGRLPFESKQLARLLFMHIKTPPPTLNSVRSAPHFTPQMEALVASALAKEKESRPASAGALYRLFEQACQSIPVAPSFIDPFGTDPEDQTVRVTHPARPTRNMIDMMPSAVPDTPSGKDALHEVTSELYDVDTATRSLEQPPPDDDEEERTHIDNINHVHKLLDEREANPALAIAVPQAALTAVSPHGTHGLSGTPAMNGMRPMSAGMRSEAASLSDSFPSSPRPPSRDFSASAHMDATVLPSMPNTAAKNFAPTTLQNGTSFPVSLPSSPRNLSPIPPAPRHAIQRAPTNRWKTVLLIILTMVLLGEILFLGWRWWQRQQPTPEPVRRSERQPTTNPLCTRPHSSSVYVMAHERNG